MRATRQESKARFGSRSRFSGLQPRTGTSLMEVLIAIMVLAIGMMGVLALFPIGAVQFAQAVKDERTSQLAVQMDGQTRILWRTWTTMTPGSIGPASDSQMFQNEPALMAMDSPNAPIAYNASFLNDPTYLASSASNTPDQPVLIDQIGWSIQTGNSQTAVAGATISGTPVLPRRGANFIAMLSPQQAQIQTLSYFSLLDDQYFASSGYAQTPVVQRQGRYTGSILLQRLAGNQRQTANLTLIVYQQRSIDFPALETVIPLTGNVTPGSDTIPVNLNGVNLPKGAWICLASAIFSWRVSRSQLD